MRQGHQAGGSACRGTGAPGVSHLCSGRGPQESSAPFMSQGTLPIPHHTGQVGHVRRAGAIWVAMTNIHSHSPGDYRPCRAEWVTRCVQQVAEADTWQLDKPEGVSCDAGCFYHWGGVSSQAQLSSKR